MARTQCFAEKRGDTWRGRYPDADGRMRSTSGYTTRNKALQAARAERARIEKAAAEKTAKAARAAKGRDHAGRVDRRDLAHLGHRAHYQGQLLAADQAVHSARLR